MCLCMALCKMLTSSLRKVERGAMPGVQLTEVDCLGGMYLRGGALQGQVTYWPNQPLSDVVCTILTPHLWYKKSACL